MRFFPLSQSLYTVFIVQNCLVFSQNGSSGVCVPLFLCSVFLFRMTLYFATENPQNCILLCMKGTNVSKSLTQGSALSSKPHLPPQKFSVGPPCGTVLTGGTHDENLKHEWLLAF